jgi:2-haloacid dehalogenase
MVKRTAAGLFSPELISFDVFGTLVDVRGGTTAAFRSILRDSGGGHVDVEAFWDHWERRNIVHYREPYRRYREICALSLLETFEHFRLAGTPAHIERYFEAFAGFALFPDCQPALERLGRDYRLALVSNIDDDLLALTRLERTFDLVCTAERARGYKPDGTLFRHLIARAGCARDDILHAGQSQLTDLVGGKPLGLTVAFINRRGLTLAAGVPRPDLTCPDLAAFAACVA